MPLLAPVTLFVVVITTISAYNVFTQVYVLASDVQGAPGRLVRVLVYDIFENGFRFFNMGYAAAEAMYLFIIILVLTVIQFRFLRGSTHDHQAAHPRPADHLLGRHRHPAPGRADHGLPAVLAVQHFAAARDGAAVRAAEAAARSSGRSTTSRRCSRPRP